MMDILVAYAQIQLLRNNDLECSPISLLRNLSLSPAPMEIEYTLKSVDVNKYYLRLCVSFNVRLKGLLDCQLNAPCIVFDAYSPLVSEVHQSMRPSGIVGYAMQ
jgi:hypothetical protein